MSVAEARAAIWAAFDAIDPRWRTAGFNGTRPEPAFSLRPRRDGRFDYVIVSMRDAGQPRFEAALRAALGDACGEPAW